MAVFKFRVAFEEDDAIYRDILLKSGQSFQLFSETILTGYEFKEKAPSSFFESNEKWSKLREISSEVPSNKKGAAKLSMLKTPVPALVDIPDKKFIFEYYTKKRDWQFIISLIGITQEEDENLAYPFVVKKEGASPALQTGADAINEKLLEIEEAYDLSEKEIQEGFGSEETL